MSCSARLPVYTLLIGIMIPSNYRVGFFDVKGLLLTALYLLGIVVAIGVAAVLKSYYPTLTPQQIKKILIKSSLKTYKSEKVIKPGSSDENELVKFEKLGKNGGITAAYAPRWVSEPDISAGGTATGQ